MGRDHTLHAGCSGIVEFTKSDEKSKKIRSYINIRKIIQPGFEEGSFNYYNIKEMVI